MLEIPDFEYVESERHNCLLCNEVLHRVIIGMDSNVSFLPAIFFC